MNFVFALAMVVASYFLQAMNAPKPQKPKPAALEDFDFPQIDEGTPQTIIFGDVWIQDWQVLWYGNMRTSSIKSEQQSK